MTKKQKPTCCPKKPKLKERPLLSVRQATGLENTFRTLGNGTRLRILHALVRGGELCVGDLAEALEMKFQAISNQLQRLADRGIVEPRRDGLQVFYRIVDPCVVMLLDRGWCLTEDATERTIDRLQAERAAG